ncbi:MAG TPA: DASS family sodium-coupled anion symporter [Chryseosolibacter sp.]|nr:DASS family sodium-coupled anion symporter [Chryseosolibacter sp.]
MAAGDQEKKMLPVKNIGLISGIVFFVLILILVPEDLIGSNSNRVLAVAALVIFWWVTEAVPMPVTALLPLLLFPFLGVMTAREAAGPYADPIIFLFMGGFLIALALEKHRLHERIALNLISFTGTSGNQIILGFMIATAGISMWISNTATAMMMLPIAAAVVNLLKADPQQRPEDLSKNEKQFALGLMLAVGYSATLGGLATPIGTPPNVVFKGLLNNFYQEELDFVTWMLVGVPVMIALVLSTYLIITRILFPNRLQHIQGSRELIRDRLRELGPLRAEEKKVLAIFFATSLMWIFQQYLNRAVIGREVFTDTNIAMCGGLLMFLVPSGKGQPLLQWSDTRNLAWGILILFGGGLCLAKALEGAGMIQFVGNMVAAKSAYGPWLVFLLIVSSVILSEFMSNVALVQIFVPVVFGISDALGVNPVLLAMPVTLSASIGFMFPVATPPNAIVFASGYIRIKDMMRAGLLLDLVSVIIVLLASMTLIRWVYG